MGFALWIDGDTARAEGTHEYRPMGAAVISVSGQFRDRDFRPAARKHARPIDTFIGFFASIGDLNRHLESRRRKRPRARRLSTGVSILPSAQ